MEQTALSSGLVLAGRYQLEDQVGELGGLMTWRAADQTLNRSVRIEALPADDHRVVAFCEAARRSTAVSDPRFLRVLDAVEDESGLTYLVREWARGISLDLVLAECTLPNRRAASVVAELAEALGNAHEAGVHHGHLVPTRISLKDSGAVRIAGLAVDRALLAPDGDQPAPDPDTAELADVQALGKVLYACLTSRWPGGQVGDLRRAPTEHGRLMRTRQVRAGVSRDVDTVCDRILGNPPRHHRPPLRNARDIAHELHLAGDDEPQYPDDQPSLIGISSPDLFRNDPIAAPTGPPPAVHPPRRKPAALAPAPPTPLQRSRARARRAVQGDRALVVSGLAVGLALVLALAFIIGRATGGRESGGRPTPTATTQSQREVAPVHPLAVQQIVSFDPEGDGEEHPEDVANVLDGDPATSWRTLDYYNRPDLGGLKSGVGLLLDLGQVRDVDSVRVRFGSAPTSYTVLMTAPDQSDPPESVNDLRAVASLGGAPARTTVDVGRAGRYVVLWLTKLPTSPDGAYAGDVREVEVRGTT